MIAVMAAFANGQTVIRDAAELKVKESDRIATVTAGLRAMGCDITPTDDGMIIRGGKTLHGAEIDSYLDHRIAMSFAVAALAAMALLLLKMRIVSKSVIPTSMMICWGWRSKKFAPALAW